MKANYLLLMFMSIVLLSCRQTISPKQYSEFQSKGNDISNLAQTTLLANVGTAIQSGGPDFAVEFCNLNASGIVDSLSKANDCVISRVSAKNRNPLNGLNTEQEKLLWAIFDLGQVKDTVVKVEKKLVYYKTIKTAMPACLKCHGVPGAEMDSITFEKIKALYPADLAMGYKLNDFRGLWKIEFEMR